MSGPVEQLITRAFITPECRENRGSKGAFDEAVRRLRAEYEAVVEGWKDEDEQPTFALMLFYERPIPDETAVVIPPLHCGSESLPDDPEPAATQPTKETYTREQLLTPVVRAEPEGERITFELECGHVVGLARSDAGAPDNLPAALLCPVCEHHEFDLYSREDLEAERERVANAMCGTKVGDPKYRRLLDRLNLIDAAIDKGKGGEDG